MSKTIEEIKDEVANEYGWKSWKSCYGDDGITNAMIDEVAERYAQSKTETIKHLAGVNIDLKKQIQELIDWKESMMKVHSDLDLQKIGNALGLQVGEYIAPKVLPKIKELQEQNAELVANIQLLLQSLDYDALGVMSELIIEYLKELLTNHNHLNKKP